MNKLEQAVIPAVFALAVAASMPASANWSESSDGDLSGDYLSPTAIALAPNAGTTVSGTIEGAGQGRSVDLDYFTVHVPSGQNLVALFVRPVTAGGGNAGSFIGLYQGTTGVNPAGAQSTDALGYYLFGTADTDTDILPDLATFNFLGTNPSQGFTPPLGTGDYTIWVQEGASGVFPYVFELVLQAVPEPPALVYLGLAGLGVASRRRSGRKV